jgi:hypothetical protein
VAEALIEGPQSVSTRSSDSGPPPARSSEAAARSGLNLALHTPGADCAVADGDFGAIPRPGSVTLPAVRSRVPRGHRPRRACAGCGRGRYHPRGVAWMDRYAFVDPMIDLRDDEDRDCVLDRVVEAGFEDVGRSGVHQQDVLRLGRRRHRSCRASSCRVDVLPGQKAEDSSFAGRADPARAFSAHPAGGHDRRPPRTRCTTGTGLRFWPCVGVVAGLAGHPLRTGRGRGRRGRSRHGGAHAGTGPAAYLASPPPVRAGPVGHRVRPTRGRPGVGVVDEPDRGADSGPTAAPVIRHRPRGVGVRLGRPPAGPRRPRPEPGPRQGHARPRRRDAALSVDECHNFLTLPGSVDDMLAEAREFRLSLVLVHQDQARLPRETQAAVSAKSDNPAQLAAPPGSSRSMQILGHRSMP